MAYWEAQNSMSRVFRHESERSPLITTDRSEVLWLELIRI